MNIISPIFPPISNEELYVCTFKIAKMWEVESYYQFCIQGLDDLDLSDSRCIQLARMFDIEHWVAPAVRSLILKPISALTSEQFFQLGRTYQIIVDAKEHIDVLRKQLALITPGLDIPPSTASHSHINCQTSWIICWFTRIVPLLLLSINQTSPITPLSEVKIRALEALKKASGLNALCKSQIMEQLTDDNKFGDEEEIIFKAISAVSMSFNM